MSRRENCCLSFSAAAEENSSSNIEYADDRAGRRVLETFISALLADSLSIRREP